MTSIIQFLLSDYISNNTFVEQLSRFSLNTNDNHLNWCFCIKDQDLRRDFHAYSISNRPYLAILIYSILYTLYVIPQELYILIETFRHLKGIFEVYSLIFYIAQLGYIFSIWGIVFMKWYPYLQIYDRFLMTLFMISSTFVINMTLFRYFLFPCKLDTYGEMFIGRDCSQQQALLPWDTGAYYVVPCIAFIIMLKETRFFMVMLSFFITMFTIGFLTLYFYPFSFSLIFLWTVIGSFVLYELHMQNVRSFFLKRKLVETLVENERMNEHNQANEMRHMIANVAHDLKTPLASFTSGLELIEHVLVDMEECNHTQSLTSELTHEKCLMMSQSLEDIRNTNSFMLMTINRCIDYTKASKGMKLVPRYETIDLMETLRLPLNCMRNIQNRIEISLKAIPEEICSHVITDKQWLQENILCLLSNAVKYSSSGEVTIQVSQESSDACKADELDTNIENQELKIKLVQPLKANSFTHNRENSFSTKVTPIDLNTEITHEEETCKICQSISPVSKEFDENHDHISKSKSRKYSLTSNKKESFAVLRFEVEDTGIGMSDEAMKSLFNPFKQTQRLAGGTGLGLYSLAKRIEALNGKYGVKQRRDGKQGSLFWFTIPYKPDGVTAEMNRKEKSDKFQSIKLVQPRRGTVDMSQYHSNNPNSTIKNDVLFLPISNINVDYPNKQTLSNDSSLTILIADDSPAILKMTTLMLRRQGHEVHQAENGALAVKMVEERWKETGKVFDLVLMDLQMPVMDGLEATRRIRKKEKEELNTLQIFDFTSDNQDELNYNQNKELLRPRQIIIGCSANSDAETTEEAMKAGVDEFMPKPFTLDTFHAISYQYIGKCKDKCKELIQD